MTDPTDQHDPRPSTFSEPYSQGDGWCITETTAAGDTVDYGYPTEAAARAAWAALTGVKK